MLNIALIAGSSRSGSQSAKVARFLRQRLIELGLTRHEQSSLLDLGERGLPLWPADDRAPGPNTSSSWPPPTRWWWSPRSGTAWPARP